MAITVLLFFLTCGLAAQPAGYAEVTYANDYFGATDYYFTQGIRLEYGRERWSAYLAQEGYTPTSIRADRILYGDRPYAGALYAGYRRRGNWTEAWRWRQTLSLGVVGPLSLAAEEQRWIHAQTGNVAPRGWRYQIANDLLLNYRLDVDRDLLVTRSLSLSAGAEGRVGTYRNRVGLHALLRAGRLPQEDRPGPRLALHLRPAAHLNLYDATLQGGLFNGGSPYTLTAPEVRRVVGRLEAGVDVGGRSWGIRFTRTFLTREFAGGRAHDWGTVVLRFGAEGAAYSSW